MDAKQVSEILDLAVRAIAAAGAIVTAVRQGLAGKIDYDEVKKRIEALELAIASQDAAALAKLKTKFGKE